MTTNQLGESQHCDACHDFQARCLIFILGPLWFLQFLFSETRFRSNPICILLLFGVCCCVLVFAVAGFPPEMNNESINSGSLLEPSSVLNEAENYGPAMSMLLTAATHGAGRERAVQFNGNAIGCQGLCSYLRPKWHEGTMLH